jgi:4-carboxymuconolactone decarboxylase
MADELYETGIAIREQMWGPEGGHLKVEGASEFQRDLEELVTTYCFGATWGRSGLTHAERSMLTIGMLIALGRSHELGVHVVGGINNGLSREQIKEILLHSAAYCGIPAAVSAFRTAEPVLDGLEANR